MAKNTGASRRNCPECRNPFCDEVEPNEALSIRLDDLVEERDDLDSAFEEIYQEKERLNSYIDRLLERLREAENRRDASCTPEASPSSSTPLFDISGIIPRELFPDTREDPDRRRARHSLERQGGLRRFDDDATLPDIRIEFPLDVDDHADTCEDCLAAAYNLQEVEYLVAKDVCIWIDDLIGSRRSEIGVFCALEPIGGIEGITPECVKRLTGKLTGEILSKYGLVKKYRRENVVMQKERLLSILEFRDEWVETTIEGEWILRRGWVVEKMGHIYDRFNAVRLQHVSDGL